MAANDTLLLVFTDSEPEALWAISLLKLWETLAFLANCSEMLKLTLVLVLIAFSLVFWLFC